MVYLYWFGVGSRMSLAGLPTSMTEAWIAMDYHDLTCSRVSVKLFTVVLLEHSSMPLLLVRMFIPNACAVQSVTGNAAAVKRWTASAISQTRSFGFQYPENHLSPVLPLSLT